MTPRRPQGPITCGVMRLFSPGATHLGPVPQLVGLQSPAACATRVGGDFGPNFESWSLLHAQSPYTGRGVHARLWRASRCIDVRR